MTAMVIVKCPVSDKIHEFRLFDARRGKRQNTAIYRAFADYPSTYCAIMLIFGNYSGIRLLFQLRNTLKARKGLVYDSFVFDFRIMFAFPFSRLS